MLTAGLEMQDAIFWYWHVICFSHTQKLNSYKMLLIVGLFQDATWYNLMLPRSSRNSELKKKRCHCFSHTQNLSKILLSSWTCGPRCQFHQLTMFFLFLLSDRKDGQSGDCCPMCYSGTIFNLLTCSLFPIFTKTKILLPWMTKLLGILVNCKMSEYGIS